MGGGGGIREGSVGQRAWPSIRGVGGSNRRGFYSMGRLGTGEGVPFRQGGGGDPGLSSARGFVPGRPSAASDWWLEKAGMGQNEEYFGGGKL